jgi:hypothetical protein
MDGIMGHVQAPEDHLCFQPFRRRCALQKITFGDMRESGVRGVLIYCSNYHCSHYAPA